MYNLKEMNKPKKDGDLIKTSKVTEKDLQKIKISLMNMAQHKETGLDNFNQL